VIFYEYKNLKEHEKNYVTHDLELIAIIHALNMWRHYLMGRKSKLIKDHTGLKYLFQQQTLNDRQTRWLEFLSEYDFDIKHIRGKENKVVDALSRRIHVLHVPTISMSKFDSKNKILEVVTSY
jgi:hypothetical protein